MSKELFDNIKQNIKYKFLGRSVSISTINSKVKFSGCASISFKIEKQHFRHHIYLSEIGENSPFAAILGYDFISKYNILIFPEMSSSKINNEFIYFHNHQPRDNKKIKEIFQNHIHMKQLIEEKKNEEILENSQLTKFINAPPFIPENLKKPNNLEIVVQLAEKIIIPPEESLYCQATVKLHKNLWNIDLLFNPNSKEDRIKIYEGFYICFHPEDHRVLTEFSQTTENSKNRNKNFTIYIY